MAPFLSGLNIHAYIYNASNKFESCVTSVAGSEKTEIVYGTSNVLNLEIEFFSNARLKVLIYEHSG
jgi:hypothetical protein